MRCWDVQNASNVVVPSQENEDNNDVNSFNIPNFLPYGACMINQESLVVAGDSVPPPILEQEPNNGSDAQGSHFSNPFMFCAPSGNVHVISSW